MAMKTVFASEGSSAAEKTGSHRKWRALLGCEDVNAPAAARIATSLGGVNLPLPAI
jgi:hypothetical protein